MRPVPGPLLNASCYTPNVTWVLSELEYEFMEGDDKSLREAIESYLRLRPRWIRWQQWLNGRRYVLASFPERGQPLIIIAHSFRDAGRARQVVAAVERDWIATPAHCREAYVEILGKAPGILVIQLRRSNVCGCLGHRHVSVREAPFADPHDAFCGVLTGEMDIAYERVESWLALPLMDTALDTQFVPGSRLKEFHAQQLRLRLLSILLHETHHMVAPREAEDKVRDRSLAFYREALAYYVENARESMSLTIDRSFSRFGRD
jgi:hypothetical protein